MIRSNACALNRSAIFCVFVLCGASIQALPTEVEDEWDALDAPTKEIYEDAASDLVAPKLTSVESQKEPAQAAPVRQALKTTCRINIMRSNLLETAKQAFTKLEVLLLATGPRHGEIWSYPMSWWHF